MESACMVAYPLKQARALLWMEFTLRNDARIHGKIIADLQLQSINFYESQFQQCPGP